MNWYGRDTNNRRDPKLLKLYRRYGCEGTQLYWLVVDLIAEKICDNNLTFTLEETTEDLMFELSQGPKKWETKEIDAILNYCIELALFDREVIPGQVGRIRCTKILTRLNDNMSRNPTVIAWIKASKQKQKASNGVQTSFELTSPTYQSTDQSKNQPIHLPAVSPQEGAHGFKFPSAQEIFEQEQRKRLNG